MNLIKALSCPDLTSNGHLSLSGKKVPKKGHYRPIMGIIWGSILAYFAK
jgi:hypothetical protein